MTRLVDMPDLQSNSVSRFRDDDPICSPEGGVPVSDAFMEQILENINTTPIGQVLKRIASLPEVRREKVLLMRQQLHQGMYNEGDHLEAAVDRVLEDLMS